MRWYTASDVIRASGLKFRETIDIPGTILFVVVMGFIISGIWRIFT